MALSMHRFTSEIRTQSTTWQADRHSDSFDWILNAVRRDPFQAERFWRIVRNSDGVVIAQSKEQPQPAPAVEPEAVQGVPAMANEPKLNETQLDTMGISVLSELALRPISVIELAPAIIRNIRDKQPTPQQIAIVNLVGLGFAVLVDNQYRITERGSAWLWWHKTGVMDNNTPPAVEPQPEAAATEAATSNEVDYHAQFGIELGTNVYKYTTGQFAWQRKAAPQAKSLPVTLPEQPALTPAAMGEYAARQEATSERIEAQWTPEQTQAHLQRSIQSCKRKIAELWPLRHQDIVTSGHIKAQRHLRDVIRNVRRLEHKLVAIMLSVEQLAPEAIETVQTPLGHHIGIRNVGKRFDDTVTYKRIVHLDSGQVWRVRVSSALVKDSENSYNLHYTITNEDNGIAFSSTPRQWIVKESSRYYPYVVRKLKSALYWTMGMAVQDCMRLIDEVMMPPIAGNGGERPRFVYANGKQGD